MSSETNIDQFLAKSYRHGFVTDIDSDTLPPGLDEDVVRFISRKKKEPAFLTEWRLKAYRHWLTMREPHWAKLRVNPIDYQGISYFSAPRPRADAPKSLDDVDMGEQHHGLGRWGRSMEHRDEVAAPGVSRWHNYLNIRLRVAAGFQARRHGVRRPRAVSCGLGGVDLDELFIEIAKSNAIGRHGLGRTNGGCEATCKRDSYGSKLGHDTPISISKHKQNDQEDLSNAAFRIALPT
jgi:hypothetical protein